MSSRVPERNAINLTGRDGRRLTRYIDAYEKRIALNRDKADAYLKMLMRHERGSFDAAWDASAIKTLPLWQPPADLPIKFTSLMNHEERKNLQKINKLLKQNMLEGESLRGGPDNVETHKRLVELEFEKCELCDQAIEPLRRIESQYFSQQPSDNKIQPSDDEVPTARSVSNSVLLFAPGDKPIVKGKPMSVLTSAQYDVVHALLRAGEDGLSKDALDEKSGHGDARKVLKRLAENHSHWAKVISFPGTTGKRYRIH